MLRAVVVRVTRIAADYAGKVVRRPGESEDEARARIAQPSRTEHGGPAIANDAHQPVDHGMPKWCVRPGGVVYRLHRKEHFLAFDPGLPHYRRCSRCGATVYVTRPSEL